MLNVVARGPAFGVGFDARAQGAHLRKDAAGGKGRGGVASSSKRKAASFTNRSASVASCASWSMPSGMTRLLTNSSAIFSISPWLSPGPLILMPINEKCKIGQKYLSGGFSCVLVI